MHLKVEDIPFDLLGRVEVYLDGVKQDYVVVADDTRGFIEVYMRCPTTHSFIMNGDRVARQTLWGKHIEIRLV
jgi:hypothetical protein